MTERQDNWRATARLTLSSLNWANSLFVCLAGQSERVSRFPVQPSPLSSPPLHTSTIKNHRTLIHIHCSIAALSHTLLVLHNPPTDAPSSLFLQAQTRYAPNTEKTIKNYNNTSYPSAHGISQQLFVFFPSQDSQTYPGLYSLIDLLTYWKTSKRKRPTLQQVIGNSSCPR